jgi:hypothetical protein
MEHNKKNKQVCLISEKKEEHIIFSITFFSFQPTSGGKQMTNDNTHSPAISDLARRVDIILG